MVGLRNVKKAYTKNSLNDEYSVTIGGKNYPLVSESMTGFMSKFSKGGKTRYNKIVKSDRNFQNDYIKNIEKVVPYGLLTSKKFEEEASKEVGDSKQKDKVILKGNAEKNVPSKKVKLYGEVPDSIQALKKSMGRDYEEQEEVPEVDEDEIRKGLEAEQEQEMKQEKYQAFQEQQAKKYKNSRSAPKMSAPSMPASSAQSTSSSTGRVATAMAKGGLLRGPSHDQGGVKMKIKPQPSINGKPMKQMAELEGGEFIVNKKATQKNLKLLQKINNEGIKNMDPKYIKKHSGTRKFPDGTNENVAEDIEEDDDKLPDLEYDNGKKVLYDSVKFEDKKFILFLKGKQVEEYEKKDGGYDELAVWYLRKGAEQSKAPAPAPAPAPTPAPAPAPAPPEQPKAAEQPKAPESGLTLDAGESINNNAIMGKDEKGEYYIAITKGGRKANGGKKFYSDTGDGKRYNELKEKYETKVKVVSDEAQKINDRKYLKKSIADTSNLGDLTVWGEVKARVKKVFNVDFGSTYTKSKVETLEEISNRRKNAVKELFDKEKREQEEADELEKDLPPAIGEFKTPATGGGGAALPKAPAPAPAPAPTPAPAPAPAPGTGTKTATGRGGASGNAKGSEIDIAGSSTSGLGSRINAEDGKKDKSMYPVEVQKYFAGADFSALLRYVKSKNAGRMKEKSVDAIRKLCQDLAKSLGVRLKYNGTNKEWLLLQLYELLTIQIGKKRTENKAQQENPNSKVMAMVDFEEILGKNARLDINKLDKKFKYGGQVEEMQKYAVGGKVDVDVNFFKDAFKANPRQVASDVGSVQGRTLQANPLYIDKMNEEMRPLEPDEEGAIPNNENKYKRKTFDLADALFGVEKDYSKRNAEKLQESTDLYKGTLEFRYAKKEKKGKKSIIDIF